MASGDRIDQREGRPETQESIESGSGTGVQAETSGGGVTPPGDVADTEDRTVDDNRVTRGKDSRDDPGM